MLELDTDSARCDYPLSVVLFCVEVGGYLKNSGDLATVSHKCFNLFKARGALQHGEFQLEIPDFASTIRRWTIKMDMLTSLYQRHLLADDSIERVRFLNWDSSPQGSFDYLGIVEEVISRPACGPRRIDRQDPYGGFTWTRRSLPLSCLGHGESGVTQKLLRAVRSASLESGRLLFNRWRGQVWGAVADQGVERALSSAPLLGNGDGEVLLPMLLEDLQRGTIGIGDEGAKDSYFLPECLEVDGVLHVLFDALEDSIKDLPAWAEFAPQLRALTRTVALYGVRVAPRFEYVFTSLIEVVWGGESCVGRREYARGGALGDDVHARQSDRTPLRHNRTLPRVL